MDPLNNENAEQPRHIASHAHELHLTPVDQTLSSKDAIPILRPRNDSTGVISEPNQVKTPQQETQYQQSDTGIHSVPDPSALLNVMPTQLQPSAPVYNDVRSPGPTVEIVKTPWLKLALLGFFAPIAVGLVVSLIFGALTMTGFLIAFVLFKVGVLPLLGILVLYFTVKLMARQLDKWFILEPTIVTVCTFAATISATALVYHLQKFGFYNLVVNGSVGTVQQFAGSIAVFVPPFAGMLSLLLFTYIFNNLQRPKRQLRVGIAIAIALLPALTMLLYSPKPSVDSVSTNSTSGNGATVMFPKVNDLQWAYLPSYLPPGISGLDECKKQPGGYDFYCDFRYDRYPSYVNTETRTKTIAKYGDVADARVYGLWATVTETKDDPVFDAFKYRNGKCDILNMDSLAGEAQAYRKSDKNHRLKPSACTKEVTPGKTVIYTKFQTELGSTYPAYYYFVKNGTLIMVSNESFYAKQLILQDPSYKTQRDMFVDSFKRSQ